jgi:hypothetical protein
MKTFRITSWATRADTPDRSQAVVAVLEGIGDIVKKEEYEFDVVGSYDTITDEFKAEVEAVLTSSNLL